MGLLFAILATHMFVEVGIGRLTNSLEVYGGEELILEVREKKPERKGETKRTWKDAFAAEEKLKGEAKRAGKPKKELWSTKR